MKRGFFCGGSLGHLAPLIKEGGVSWRVVACPDGLVAFLTGSDAYLSP
jgi:hypothetical protein